MKRLLCVIVSAMMIAVSLPACSSGPKVVETLSEGLDAACSHSFGDWEEINPSTCGENGREERVCEDCGGKEINLYETLPHTEETVPGKPATCHTTGTLDGRHCTVCGQTTLENKFAPIDPTKHQFEEITVEPTLIISGNTKKICTICGYNAAGENKGPVDPTVLGLPVLFFEGDYQSATKSKTVTVKASVKGEGLNFSSYATLKWQGNSSIRYDKKNYTVKFYKDEELTDKYKFDPFGWGKENEYCLKANWIDATQARNVVNARLWGQVCATRKKLDKNLADLPNYGAIDGYPVLVYMNGEFYGIYTMNIPKDKWMFDMKNDETKKQAIFMGAQWGDSSKLLEEIPYDLGIQWEIEHCSTEDTRWAVDSFNRLIKCINDPDEEAFKKNISKYVDVEAAIDHMIFTLSIGGHDNYGKNILYATYDGVKWIPSVYDMDTSWGLYWDGSKYVDAGTGLPIVAKRAINFVRSENQLWRRLMLTHKDQVAARYEELRAGVLSDKNIKEAFSSFMDGFPTLATMAEAEKWPHLPNINTDYREQLLKFIPSQMLQVDRFFEEYKNSKI